MPLGKQPLPDSKNVQWRREHGYAAEPTYPEQKKGGGAVIVGIGAAAVILALLGIAAASGGGAAPTTKKKTKISSLIATWYDEGTSILYYWDGYLQELDTGTGINGKTIKLQLMLSGSNTWITIDTKTTANRGGTGPAGYFFFYKTYPKPLASKVRIIFDGDSQYEGVESSYENVTTPSFPPYW
jgi:hypothetical protein